MTSIEEVTTKATTRSVTDAVTRITELINAKGMKVFAVIDQRDEARRVGLDLRETVLVLFGSPVAGTPIMDAHPLAAVGLPRAAALVRAGRPEPGDLVCVRL